ncbi:uncharacterized protein IL334_002169 [Kwoniella shivajii]|uniref:Uncharacterized protein n=1 Tax=Kwoniella shivajii TaxID=564305 RepID=A0ABZ1CX03_9TREE|nr:hypothetical protein IL334_002169 [Kwoniella shivajii]
MVSSIRPTTISSTETPRCPNGLFNFDEGVLVEDADEEIMELYMSLASVSSDKSMKDTDPHSGGLGFLNSNESVLEITIDLSPPTLTFDDVKLKLDKRSKRKYKNSSLNSTTGNTANESISVKIQQDLGMLKGPKGDTGSILWRSSLYLSTILLRQYHQPSTGGVDIPILDLETLKSASVLELGSGTGLLSVLLSRICKVFTASDRLENLKLVKRNLGLNGISIVGDVSSKEDAKLSNKSSSKGKQEMKHVNGSVNIEEIDWIAVSEERKRHPESWLLPSPNDIIAKDENHDNGNSRKQQYDMILAVDCIYNEHLVQPLVDTFGKYCPRGGKTVIWVVIELRSADVLTLFLETWMNDPSGPWTIVRLSEKSMGNWDGKKARWVGWVGWR